MNWEEVRQKAEEYRRALLEYADQIPLRFAVVIFGGGKLGSETTEYGETADLALALNREGIDVVTGGEAIGLMEAANEAAFNGGGPGRSIACNISGGKRPTSKFVHGVYNGVDYGSRLDTFCLFGSIFIVAKGGLGSDLERAFIQHHVDRLAGEGLDRGAYFANPAVRLGYTPKLVLVGDHYRYVTEMCQTMISSRVAGSRITQTYELLPRMATVLPVVLAEREIWRGILVGQGRAPEN